MGKEASGTSSSSQHSPSTGSIAITLFLHLAMDTLSSIYCILVTTCSCLLALLLQVATALH